MRRNQPFEVRGIDAVIFRLEQDPFVSKTIRIEQKDNGSRTITYRPLGPIKH